MSAGDFDHIPSRCPCLIISVAFGGTIVSVAFGRTVTSVASNGMITSVTFDGTIASATFATTNLGRFLYFELKEHYY